MTADKAAIESFQQDYKAMLSEMEKVVVGCREALENTLVCMLAGGNLLIESSPGLGKTLIAKTISKIVDLKFSRIQFTPDLMPADIVGTTMVDQDASGKKHFKFEPGPIFAQLLLADEINRSTPKTQSALLEAMQERRVTAGGHTYPLESPYFVIGTMNAQDASGTYALPEAQMDRFLFKLTLTKPGIDGLEHISDRAGLADNSKLKTIATAARIEQMKAMVLSVQADEKARQAVIQLILKTNPASDAPTEMARKFLRFGSSPRGAQALVLACKVWALISGRNHIIPQDIARVAHPILGHRLRLNFAGDAEGVSVEDVIDDSVSQVLGTAKARSAA
jgi:MoxR-like ATPase